VPLNDLKDPQEDSIRVKDPKWLVVLGVYVVGFAVSDFRYFVFVLLIAFIADALTWVVSPWRVPATTAAGSVRATVPTTTSAVASDKVPHRSIWRCLRMRSLRMAPRCASDDASTWKPLSGNRCFVCVCVR
jgi:hypothetical protein